ncbi:MAG: hypothetical protein GEU99_16700 [Luteitalea sp.]|nr:hypothetical protein [Luteitalea sp.]
MPEIQVQVPEELESALRDHIAAGEFADASALVAEAVRYYLDRHPLEAWQEYVRQEIEWSRQHAGR